MPLYDRGDLMLTRDASVLVQCSDDELSEAAVRHLGTFALHTLCFGCVPRAVLAAVDCRLYVAIFSFWANHTRAVL